MSYKRSIIILADGARPDVLENLAKKGDLPNISRYLMDEGTYRHGVTTFPSTTGPAYLPFLTGALPGTCNLPGIRWLDRERFGKKCGGRNKHRSYVGIDTFKMNSDFDHDIKTIFEISPKSYSIFNMLNRGAGNRNLTKIMRIWYWYYAHLTDRWGFIDKMATEKMLAAVDKKDLEFLFVVYPGIDEYAHFSDPFSDRVVESYRCVDEAIGKLIKKLKEKGEYEQTLIWLVSDHGLSATHTHFCLNTFLESRGIKTFYYPLVFRSSGVRAANMMSGNGMSHLYFSHHDKWGDPFLYEDFIAYYPSLLDELLAEEAVDVLALKNRHGDVMAMTKRGKALISSSQDQLSYRTIEGNPFGYGLFEDKLATISSRDSLELTIDTPYPDLPFQLAHIFNASRTGDVVVSAKSGFDLRLKYENPEHKSSHGSIHKDHMLVPVATNLKHSRKTLRTVDIFPTILKELGYPIPSNIDGEILS